MHGSVPQLTRKEVVSWEVHRGVGAWILSQLIQEEVVSWEGVHTGYTAGI